MFRDRTGGGGKIVSAFPTTAPLAATPSASTEGVAPRSRDQRRLARRDAIGATAVLLFLIALGSRWFTYIDPALLGYLGATLIAFFGTVWRISAVWRRPASALYGRALAGAVFSPAAVCTALRSAAGDLVAQSFIRSRSRPRWIAHMLLSLGTLVSFAITLPLVFGWMHFAPSGESHYRLVAFGVPTLRLHAEGVPAWLMFHALSVAAVAVAAGAFYFLATRLRARQPACKRSADLAPLILLLVVALSGLALPASRNWARLFEAAAWLHQLSVIALLAAMPFSKLGHLLVRPLQIGVRVLRDREEPWAPCAECGEPIAPRPQQESVSAILAARNGAAAATGYCPKCRRRCLALAQATLVGGRFRPIGMRTDQAPAGTGRRRGAA